MNRFSDSGLPSKPIECKYSSQTVTIQDHTIIQGSMPKIKFLKPVQARLNIERIHFQQIIKLQVVGWNRTTTASVTN